MGTLPTAHARGIPVADVIALMRAQTPEALETIRAAVRAEAATYATASGVEVPMGAVLTAARKPESRDQNA